MNKKELKRLVERYDRQTAEISTEQVMDLLENDQRNDLLMLLQIAENHEPLGKTKAIVIAFKLGYLAGQQDLKQRILEYFGEGIKNDKEHLQDY